MNVNIETYTSPVQHRNVLRPNSKPKHPTVKFDIATCNVQRQHRLVESSIQTSQSAACYFKFERVKVQINNATCNVQIQHRSVDSSNPKSQSTTFKVNIEQFNAQRTNDTVQRSSSASKSVKLKLNIAQGIVHIPIRNVPT